jgi:membrane-associated protease RseP (regulator of RpoE activity)
VKTTETEQDTRNTGWFQVLVFVAVLVLLGLRQGWTLRGVVVSSAIILALVAMIFLHELGHYLTAKAAGMKVTEFFLGFGPRIWSFRKGETEYGVKAIPAGAYVKIIGMNNLDEVDPADEERTYRAKSTRRRLSVAVAGSTMHFILAFVLICIVVMGFGLPRPSTTADFVSGPAKEAGLVEGDKILGIDGEEVSGWEELSAEIRSRPGKSVDFVIERDGERRTLTADVASERPDGTKVGYLGVGPGSKNVRFGPWEGVKEMGRATKESIAGLGKLFSPSGLSDYVDTLTSSDESGSDGGSGGGGNTNRPTSVIGIVGVGSQAAESGVVNVIYLLFVVNMFIGIFNLTPLLPFDGGHVVIALYEKVRSVIAGRRYQADVAKLLPLTYAVVLVLALLFVTTAYLDLADPINL